MKKYKILLIALLPILFVTFSCDEDKDLLAELEAQNPLPEPVTGDAGSLSLTKYVAIGNSTTAGFMDGALYTDGQQQSIPALLAQQFQIEGVGGGVFQQPDINSANGFSGLDGEGNPLGRLVLSLSQQRPVPTPGELPSAFSGDKAALNNFSVPGMRIVDVNDPGLVSNGLYARFASNPGTSTVLGDALAASPTFFTYWLGNNDILGYAAGGGDDESLITSQGDFQNALATSLGGLVQSGAQGVVMTLPPLVLLPYFRAVPYNAIALDTDQASQLNSAFTSFNLALVGLNQLSQSGSVPGLVVTADDVAQRTVQYTAGPNPILMQDDALTDYSRPGGEFDIMLGAGFITPAQRAALDPFGQSRPATADDLPTLIAASSLGSQVGGNPQALLGISVPAPDNLILSASEVQTVVGTRATYNATIAGVVAQLNQASGGAITLVDVQPAFVDLFGLSPALASFLIDPSSGANPFLASMGQAAAAAADGQLGIEVQGVNLRPDFAPNGVFSTDGIHPNPRGNAIIANIIIDALNASKDANIPSINVLALRSVITTN